MAANITTTAPHHHSLCASHSHGLDDIAGHVVTITRYDNATSQTTREDVAYIDGATHYGEAVELAHKVRAQIASGDIDATYAVIDTVYTSGCRPI
jgi:hypothetical protein